MIQAFLNDDSGNTVIEYGLIVALISIAILAAVMSLGDSVDTAYTSVNDQTASVIAEPASD